VSLSTDPRAVIPPSRQTSNLTVLAAGAMGFLAVLAIAVILVGNRLAVTWTATLSGTATLTLPTGTPEDTVEKLSVNLAEIPDLTLTRVTDQEQTALLAPWLGEGVEPKDLPLPIMLEITTPGPIPAEAITKTTTLLGVTSELDTHERWRDPLTAFARKMTALALAAAVVIIVALVSMVTLASEAALSANLAVIRTLRLVGASDSFIAQGARSIAYGAA
jgi:cell division transport system permease protein